MSWMSSLMGGKGGGSTPPAPNVNPEGLASAGSKGNELLKGLGSSLMSSGGGEAPDLVGMPQLQGSDQLLQGVSPEASLQQLALARKRLRGVGM